MVACDIVLATNDGSLLRSTPKGVSDGGVKFCGVNLCLMTSKLKICSELIALWIGDISFRGAISFGARTAKKYQPDNPKKPKTQKTQNVLQETRDKKREIREKGLKTEKNVDVPTIR